MNNRDEWGLKLREGRDGLVVADVDSGSYLMVFSRWPNEPYGEWCLDTLMDKRNGYVHFMHGEGSRCCAKQVASPMLAGRLEYLRDALLAQKVHFGG